MGRLALGLARIGVTPNQVSMAGLFFGVMAGVVLAISGWYADAVGPEPTARALLLAAVVFVQLRLVCNLIDGMVAVEAAQARPDLAPRKSPFGVLYNELPDRISDAATLIGAGYAATGHPGLGWFAAVVAVMTAYIRAVGKAETGVNDFCGPMAKPHRMAAVSIGCVIAAVVPASGHDAIFDAMASMRVHLPGILADALAPRSATAPSFGVLGGVLLVIAVGTVWNCVRRTVRIAARLRSAQTPAARG
jgi:phosphatidylglycerophosphate synthase